VPIPDKDETSTQGTNVFAFKNGYCLIVRRFEIPPNKGDAPLEIAGPPSNPVHGTFSIQATSNGKFSPLYFMIIIRGRVQLHFLRVLTIEVK
jgi:hypothetical protein